VTTDATGPQRAPLTLRVAAGLVGLEAAALVAVGVSVLLSSSGARVALDATTTLFFFGYAGGLLVCARGLRRARSWSRGPVVFAQLIQLGVAWSFWSGSTTAVSVLLLMVAGIVIGLVLAPASTAALHGPAESPRDQSWGGDEAVGD